MDGCMDATVRECNKYISSFIRCWLNDVVSTADIIYRQIIVRLTVKGSKMYGEWVANWSSSQLRYLYPAELHRFFVDLWHILNVLHKHICFSFYWSGNYIYIYIYMLTHTRAHARTHVDTHTHTQFYITQDLERKFCGIKENRKIWNWHNVRTFSMRLGRRRYWDAICHN